MMLLENEMVSNNFLTWLWGVFEMFLDFVETLKDLLEYEFSFGSYNISIMAILFGGGFFVFIGLLLVKWFIPLS